MLSALCSRIIDNIVHRNYVTKNPQEDIDRVEEWEKRDGVVYFLLRKQRPTDTSLLHVTIRQKTVHGS